MFQLAVSREMSVLVRARALLGHVGGNGLQRYCTTTSIAQRSLYRKLNVEVGASLQLNLWQVNADVDVCTGDNMEQIEVKALWNHAVTVPVSFNAISQQNNRVSLDLQSNESKFFLQKVEAVIPGRWCNLFVEAGGGRVTIQNMKEAYVNVTTSGGDITLGEVQGNEACIKSNGGFVRAALITAALELKTGGGGLSLGKAIGTCLQIDTGGGDMVIGSAYGQDVKISSGGGCIVIKHLQAQERAQAFPSSRHAIWRRRVGQFVLHLFQESYSPSRHLCTSAKRTLNSVQTQLWLDRKFNWSALHERQLQVAFKLYSTQSSAGQRAKEETTQKDLTAQDEDPFDSLTDKIPQKPVTIVEGASYSLVILFGFAVAGFAAYGVFKELLFEPKEYKVFNKALNRVQNDNQVTVRIGTPITGYGQDTRNRAARQHIPHRTWADEDGVQRIEVQFYVRGPHGVGRVHSEMFKDTVDKQWKFTYLIVDILSPSPTRLMLESYIPA